MTASRLKLSDHAGKPSLALIAAITAVCLLSACGNYLAQVPLAGPPIVGSGHGITEATPNHEGTPGQAPSWPEVQGNSVVAPSSFAPPATLIDTLVLVNRTLLNGNVIPENAAYPTGIALDPKDGKLFVSGGDGGVAVINTTTNRLVDVIQTKPAGQDYDVAYDAANGEVYATHSTTANTVTAINATSDAIVETIVVGSDPQGVAVDPLNGNVYVVNGGSNNVSVIDGGANQVTGSIRVGSNPTYMAIDPSNGKLFVTNYNDDTVTIIAGSSGVVLGNATVGLAPIGITFDPRNGDVYVVNTGPGIPSNPYGNVTVLNGSTGGFVTSIPVGACPLGAAYDDRSGVVLVTDTTCQNGGYMTLISGTSNKVVGTVGTGTYPVAVTYDNSSNLVYVVNAYWYYNLTILNGTTWNQVGTVSTGELPTAIAYDPVNEFMYVADMGNNDVAVINGSTGSEIGTIEVGYGPDALTYDPTNGYLFVTNSLSGNVSVVSPTSRASVASITVGRIPDAIAYDSTSGNLYVGNCGSDNVSVVDGLTWRVTRSLPAGICPDAMTYDSLNGNLYVANQGLVALGEDSNITIINATSGIGVASVNVTGSAGSIWPLGVGVDYRNGLVYVADGWSTSATYSGSILAINGTTENVTRWIWLNSSAYGTPGGIAVDDSTGDIYVAAHSFYGTEPLNGVFRIDGTTNAVYPGESSVGAYPEGIAFDGSNDRAFVADSISGTVSVLQPTTHPASEYTVTLRESGLSAGTSWSVTLNGTASTTSLPVMTFSLPNGSYSFSVAPVPGYGAPTASGPLRVNGANLTVLVDFHLLYTVTFEEVGLFANTTWAVTWNGTPRLSNETSLSINAINGSYPFSIDPVQGYLPPPPGANLIVAGPPQPIQITFQPILYPVTFVRGGLIIQAGWTVTLAGSVKDSTDGNITFEEPNGTGYQYSVALNAGNCYMPDPSTGSLNVSGATVTETIIIQGGPCGPPPCASCGTTKTPPAATLLGFPAAEGYALLGGIAAAVVVVAAVLMIRTRRRKAPPDPRQASPASPGNRSPSHQM
jgi:YVTN family beta-propeller protein